MECEKGSARLTPRYSEHVSLCNTCVLAPMCERKRRIEDACIDPIMAGLAVVVECAAWKEEGDGVAVMMREAT
jgi:hypothetical protein